MYNKTFKFDKERFEDNFDDLGNNRFSLEPSRKNGLQIVSLSLVIECASIVNENIVFSILMTVEHPRICGYLQYSPPSWLL